MPQAWPEVPATTEERHLAAGCHALSIFFPYLAPLAFFLLKRRSSRFVAVHALQAFYEALVLNIVLIVAGAISLGFTIVKVYELVETRGQSFTWDLVWTTLLKAAATWLIFGVVSAVYFLSSILQAIRAYRGRWKPSMISGRLAARSAGVRSLPRSSEPVDVQA